MTEPETPPGARTHAPGAVAAAPVPGTPSAGAPALATPAAVADRTAGPGADPWTELRRHTPARIALGRAGTSLPTAELLGFAAAHAQARDAVNVPLDVGALAAALGEARITAVGEARTTAIGAARTTAIGAGPGDARAEAAAVEHADVGTGAEAAILQVSSSAPTRAAYLRRPDWGRRLAPESAERLRGAAGAPVDLVIVLADGLSATAVQRHAPALVAALIDALGAELRLAPLVIATQARVALADEVGALLRARAALILIGERPGLSSPNSLGAYLTHEPKPGCSDAQRNCVSNIRPEGLAPAVAAARIAWLVREALRRRLTGVGLKDNSATDLLPGAGG
jgi:ethanolamine ammonia-lyase small subunit